MIEAEQSLNRRQLSDHTGRGPSAGVAGRGKKTGQEGPTARFDLVKFLEFYFKV